MANPPFNLSNWGADKLKDDVRWKFGMPPAGNANYAWIQHMIHHLAPNGKIGLVLANGALSSQSSGEGDIRKRIIEADLVEGAIDILSLLHVSGLVPSKSEARRAVTQGGVTVDGEKVTDIKTVYTKEQLAGDGIVLKRGKKNFRKITM